MGALRNVDIPAAGLQLVDQIEASTLALDGLFGALLDISRLDAGIVDVQRSAFAVDDLLARICADHAGDAAARSLELIRVPCSAVVFTDPVLMERIQRNLVVNAIRHTGRGASWSAPGAAARRCASRSGIPVAAFRRPA